MKKTKKILALMAIIVTLSILSASTGTWKAFGQGIVPGLVKGVVFDKETETVLSKARVILSQSSVQIGEIVTSVDGLFIFSLPAGEYELLVRKGGFKLRTAKISVITSETLVENIGLVPVKTVENLNNSIKATGTQFGTSKNTSSLFSFLLGNVLDGETGLGVSGANIEVKRIEDVVETGVTTDSGAFSFELSPGDYVVSADKDKIGESTKEVTIPVFETVQLDLVLEVDETPVATTTPTPVPTATPDIGDVCVAKSIVVMPKAISVKAGRAKRVRVAIKQERKLFGCSVDVNINCESGCEMFKNLDESMTTNKRGIAFVKIKTNKGTFGSATIKFSLDGLETILPVEVIR